MVMPILFLAVVVAGLIVPRVIRSRQTAAGVAAQAQYWTRWKKVAFGANASFAFLAILPSEINVLAGVGVGLKHPTLQSSYIGAAIIAPLISALGLSLSAVLFSRSRPLSGTIAATAWIWYPITIFILALELSR